MYGGYEDILNKLCFKWFKSLIFSEKCMKAVKITTISFYNKKTFSDSFRNTNYHKVFTFWFCTDVFSEQVFMKFLFYPSATLLVIDIHNPYMDQGINTNKLWTEHTDTPIVAGQLLQFRIKDSQIIVGSNTSILSLDFKQWVE